MSVDVKAYLDYDRWPGPTVRVATHAKYWLPPDGALWRLLGYGRTRRAVVREERDPGALDHAEQGWWTEDFYTYRWRCELTAADQRLIDSSGVALTVTPGIGHNGHVEDLLQWRSLDVFGATWLELHEYRTAIGAYRQDHGEPDAEYLAVLAAMNALDVEGKHPRLVLWWDG